MYIGIVEDNAAVLEMVEAMLKLHGHQVEGHRNASSFFASLQKAEPAPPYDLVITDLVLGRQSGTEIIEALNGARPQIIPTIVMSAASESLFTPIKKHYPNIEILKKPFKIEMLMMHVNRALSARGIRLSAARQETA